MPAPSTCVVSGTLYDAGGAVLPNTVVTFLMPQQVIGGATVTQSIISTITDSLGAISPVALPQTAIVFATIAAGIMVRGIVPAAATGDLAALLAGTVFSGSLSGATIQANGVNLQSQLLINFLNGRDMSLVNTSGGNITFGLVPLITDSTEIVVSSSITESAIFTDGVPGGTLGTTGVILGWANLLLNSIVHGSSCVIRLKFGGITFLTPVLVNTAGSTLTLVPIHIEFNIRGRGATNAQNVFGQIFLQPINSAGLYFGAPNVQYTNSRGNLTVDSTVSQSIQVTAEWSVNSVSNSLQGDGLYAY